MGDPRNSISSALSHLNSWFWEGAPVRESAAPVPSEAGAQPEPLSGSKSSVPQLTPSLDRDARRFADSPFATLNFSFRSELAQEFKEIYRNVAVYGDRAQHPQTAPAAEAMDDRHHTLRLWAAYQQSRRVLQEDGLEQVDAYHLRTGLDLIAELSGKMEKLSEEEGLELGVHLVREMKFLRQHQQAYSSGSTTETEEASVALARRSLEVTALVGEDLESSLKPIQDPKRRYLAMGEFQELRAQFGAADTKVLPDFQLAITSQQNERAALREKLSAVESEINRLPAGPERMMLRVQILETLWAYGMDSESGQRLQQWSQGAAKQEASPELLQEWLGLSAALMQHDVLAPQAQGENQSATGLQAALGVWQRLPVQGQAAFASTLNDLLMETRRQRLDDTGEVYLWRQSVAARLDKIAFDPKNSWTPGEAAQLTVEIARAGGDWDVITEAYEKSWNALSGEERLQLRVAHGKALLEMKERYSGDAQKLKAIEEQAFILGESWRLTVTEGQLESDSEAGNAEASAMLELENLTELVKFCHQFGTALDTEGGRVSLDSLGNHPKVEQSQAPLHLLEKKLAAYGQVERRAAEQIADPRVRTLELTKLDMAQNQLGGLIGAQLVEVWPYGAVELLSKLPNVELADLDPADREGLLAETGWINVQLGLTSLYDQAKGLLRTELQQLNAEQKKLDSFSQAEDRELRALLAQQWDSAAEMDRRLKALPFEINNLTWALNSAELWAVQAAEQVAEYSSGDLQTVARAMAHFEAGRTDDAVELFQNLMERENLDSPEAQQILDSLGGSLLKLNQGRLDRQMQLLKAFARAADYPGAAEYQQAVKAGRRGRYERQVNRGLAEIGAYLRSLPQEKAPSTLTEAVHNYLKIHPESDAVRKLSDFIYQGPASELKHQREISSLLNSMDNMDSAEDAAVALSELQLLLDKDVDYWEGEGEMMMAIYHAAAQIQSHMPLGSDAARKVRYFESRIQTEEASGQFYRELFSKENAAMLALTFVGAGLAARAGQWAARAMRARLAARTAIGGVMSAAELEAVAAELVQVGRVSTVAEGEMFLASRGLLAEVTTVELADMGISQGLKIAVLPEAANVGANAATFWAFNHLTQPGAQHHNLGATALDVGVIHFAMQPFHSWGRLEGIAMRVLGGASAMTASGVLRTEIHEIFPELHLAHEGEDPLSVYSFLHNVAFGAGMEAGGAAMGGAMGAKGRVGRLDTPARQKNIQKLQKELGAIGLKIERDAQGNLNRDGEVFLMLASGHFKNASFSLGRFVQLMKGGKFGQADAYLRKNGLELNVSTDGKIIDAAGKKSRSVQPPISDEELAQLKKEIPRQILDLINDELAQVGLDFVDAHGGLNGNAKLFIALMKHHLYGSHGFSFGEFISLLKNEGGAAANQYLTSHQVPFRVGVDGKVGPQGKVKEKSFAQEEIEDLTHELEEIFDPAEDVLADLDTATFPREQTDIFEEGDTLIWNRESAAALKEIQNSFLEWLNQGAEARNDDQYGKDSHENSTVAEKPQRVKTERLENPSSLAAKAEQLRIRNESPQSEFSDPDAKTEPEVTVEDPAWLRASGERRRLHGAPAIIPTERAEALSQQEASFRRKQSDLQLRSLDEVVGHWLAAERSIIPGSRHTSVKMSVEPMEAEGGYSYFQVNIRVKGEHRAELLKQELKANNPMLRSVESVEGRENLQIGFKNDYPLVKVEFKVEKLPFDIQGAREIYSAFQKYFLPTLNAWFMQSGLKAGYAARTHAVLDRFYDLWEKSELSPFEQDALMNLVEYLKEVPFMIQHTDVIGRLYHAEQAALRVGPEAYENLQQRNDLVLDLFGRVKRELSLDELATGEIQAEHRELYDSYRNALRQLDAEILALMQLPNGEGQILGASKGHGTSFLEFNRQEADILGDLGVDAAEKLAEPQAGGAKRFILAYGLDHLLRLSQTRQDPRIDWGILRLTGALRQQLALGGRSQQTLDALLLRYQRNVLGLPLIPSRKPFTPQTIVLTGSQRNILSEQFPFGEVPFAVDSSNILQVLLALHQLARKGTDVGVGQQALRLKPLGQQLLNNIAESYGPLIQKVHPQLYQYYLSLNKNQRVGFDSGYATGGNLAGAWARVRKFFNLESGISGVNPEFLRSQLLFDLESLGRARPSAQGKIDHLPENLDQQFERGATVRKVDGQHLLLEVTENGPAAAKPVDARVYRAYTEWQKWRGFPRANAEQTVKAHEEMNAGLAPFNIEVEVFNAREFSANERGGVIYLNELLKQLPAEFFQNPYLSKIALGTKNGAAAHFDVLTGTVTLGLQGFQGSRRNFAALVLHELGHGIAEAYTRRDSHIPFQVKQQMYEAHRLITAKGLHLGLDVLNGAKQRSLYQRDIQEFLAELTMMYVAAGPKLRQHIADLPAGSAERKTWEWVYSEIQSRYFGGKEYGSTRMEFAREQSVAGENNEKKGKLREGGFQSQGPSLNYGSFAAWTDPGKYYHLMGRKPKPLANEDAVAQFRDGAIVADGMGGHGGGDAASGEVVERFLERMKMDGDMIKGFADAATAVHQYNKKNGGKAGAVAVAMRVHRQEGSVDQLEVVHSGDAKLVVFIPDGKGGYQVGGQTVDHGMAYSLLRQGKLTPLQARMDRQANVVTSCLGGKRGISLPVEFEEETLFKGTQHETKVVSGSDGLTIEPKTMELPRGAKVVMGSDGLWDNVSSEEVAQVLQQAGTPEAAVAQLKKIVDWKMDQLYRAINLIKAGQGKDMTVWEWNEQTHEMESTEVTVVEVPEGPGLFITEYGDVYNWQGQPVDHYKIDNQALYVYHHDIP